MLRLANKPGYESDLELLQKAQMLYKSSGVVSEEEFLASMLLAARYYLKKQFDAAEHCYLNALVLQDKLHGKNLQYALTLLDYARAESALHNDVKAENALDEALQIANREKSIEEKRKYLTEFLTKAGLFYGFPNRNVNSAHKLFTRAILEGESLWYPLYGWSMHAMSYDITLLDVAGRKAEAQELRRRLNSIGTTGMDPGGKNVFKFWNGENAPIGMPPSAIPSFPDQTTELVTNESPQEVYKRFIPKK